MRMRNALPAVAAAVALTTPFVGTVASADPAASTDPGYVETPISFQVRDVDHSDVACPSNGKTYTERGDIVTPSAPVSAKDAETVTLYLHGLGLGEFFWDYQGVKGYDYAAAEARDGQTSVILNRLGYGDSDHPDGDELCVGSQADIAYQEVRDLRDGDYSVGGGTATRFSRVVLAGHSYGAFIAQVESYSFGDINGLVNMDFADAGTSSLEESDAAQWTKACETSTTGYAPFALPSEVPATFFYRADPSIVSSTVARGVTDPCGDERSEAAGVAADVAHLGLVKVPVLVVFGGRDALFPPPDGQEQAARFTGSRSVSLTTLPEASHAVTLEPTRAILDSTVASWLSAHIESHQ